MVKDTVQGHTVQVKNNYENTHKRRGFTIHKIINKER